MSTATRKPRGRPRALANTKLVASLIGVQDAMSRRLYGQIRKLRREHWPIEVVRRENAAVARLVRLRCEAIPDRVAERIAQLSDARAMRELLAAEIRQTLEGLAAELREIQGSEKTEHGGPPTPRRSRTLAEARSQAARLKAHLMDFRARIVRS